MRVSFLYLLLGCVVVVVVAAAERTQDWIPLKRIPILHFYRGEQTRGRRDAPQPQLKCVGGDACSHFEPQVVSCTNMGLDEKTRQVRWDCKAKDMDEQLFRLENPIVRCEGYQYTNDPMVLMGSCALQYSLQLTEEGYGDYVLGLGPKGPQDHPGPIGERGPSVEDAKDAEVQRELLGRLPWTLMDIVCIILVGCSLCFVGYFGSLFWITFFRVCDKACDELSRRRRERHEETTTTPVPSPPPPSPIRRRRQPTMTVRLNAHTSTIPPVYVIQKPPPHDCGICDE